MNYKIKTLYALFGNPVSHSISPFMHNTALRFLKINGMYAAFEVKEAKEITEKIRSLDIAGASITIPHKVDIIPYLDKIGETAKSIGAVNTVLNENGILLGVNTDAGGAIKALSEHTQIKGKNIAVFGAGGAARAVVYGMISKGAKVTVINRTISKGERIALDFNINFSPAFENRKHNFEVLINTTPLGMNPFADLSPVKKEYLEKDMIVMDIVYNPLKTRLLKEAEEKGCKIVLGNSMFLYQGALQFELFTGLKAPLEIMRKTVFTSIF